MVAAGVGIEIPFVGKPVSLVAPASDGSHGSGFEQVETVQFRQVRHVHECYIGAVDDALDRVALGGVIVLVCLRRRR